MPSPFDPPTYGLDKEEPIMASPFDPPVYGIDLEDNIEINDDSSEHIQDDHYARERPGRQMQIDPDSENDLNQEEMEYLRQVQ